MFPDMFGLRLGDHAWVGPATAGGIFLVFLLLALIAHKVLFPLSLRLAHRVPTELDTKLIHAVRWPITLGVVVLGGYLSLRLPLELGAAFQNAADKGFATAGVALGIVAAAAVVSNGLDWYLENLAGRAGPGIDVRVLPMLRRAGSVVIYGLGGLLILDLLSINISPLIAGLGLGGLAVALALQPTLANLFAGSYVMTEGVIAPGDYIELASGISGYVVDVSWRSTRLRTWGNNLVVVPNSTFAETIITNYQRPVPAVNVYLTCGVSYDSDLFVVERVCREVMDELLDTDPNAVKEYGGWFGFESFGDSNINFWLFVQARNRLASFEIQSALMKNLHRRLRQEGIVINYPVRTLQFPDGLNPQTVPQPGDLSKLSRTQPRNQQRRRRPTRAGTQIFPNPDVQGGDAGDGPDFAGPDGPGG